MLIYIYGKDEHSCKGTKEKSNSTRTKRNHKFHNLRFRRQYPVGNYIVDFVCGSKWLIIELDGGQHNTDKNIDYDKVRTEYLYSKGYKVLRFWNNDVDSNLTGVMSEIEKHLQ